MSYGKVFKQLKNRTSCEVAARILDTKNVPIQGAFKNYVAPEGWGLWSFLLRTSAGVGGS